MVNGRRRPVQVRHICIVFSSPDIRFILHLMLPLQAMKEYTSVSFGDIVGEKKVAHLNLLETASM